MLLLPAMLADEYNRKSKGEQIIKMYKNDKKKKKKKHVQYLHNKYENWSVGTST